MGKITIQHYLNTNLKPYIIRGENYYSIYIMVIVNRKSTKVKSISFEEIYTEKDFEDILNEDNDILNQEIKTIENICTLIQDVFGIFDVTLFSMYYALMNDIFVDDIDFEYNDGIKMNFFKREKNNIGLGIEYYIFDDFSLSKNKTHGMSIFVWFSKEGQSELANYIKKQCLNITTDDIIGILNKAVFLGSMNRFSEKLQESKKGRDLFEKYRDTIENDVWRFYSDLEKLYGM